MYTIDESLSDTDFTPAEVVALAFGTARRYESITVHHWGSFGQTHDGVVDFFMRPNSPTSCHFVASDSRIHCLVSPMDASWAAGNAYGNATSIHIEARPEATDGDYATVAWLIAHLRSIYGDLPLKPHNAWAATACPGKWDLARLDREARKTATTAPLSTTKPQPIKEDTLSKAEVDSIVTQVKDHINAVMISGYTWQGKKHYGIGPVLEETQKRLGAVPAKVWSAMISRNGKIPVIQEVADAKTNTIEIKAQLAALVAIVGQLAKGQNVTIDYDRITATVQESVKESVQGALADGIDINAEITVGGTQ